MIGLLSLLLGVGLLAVLLDSRDLRNRIGKLESSVDRILNEPRSRWS